MSLHDAINDLRGVVKILGDTTIDFEMPALKNFVDGITIYKPAEPPPDVLKITLEKFLRGEENFSSRERRALPFIIYEPSITLEDAEKILRKLNFFKTSRLRSVVSVYLNHYDDSAKTKLLRRKINFLSDLAGNSLRLKKIFAAREKIFGNERFANMTNLFARKAGVVDALDEIGLTNFKASNFVQAALKNFFRSSVAVDVQFKILDELDKNFDTYKNIFPAVADALIQTVNRTGIGRRQCIEIFYRRLGDPRFGWERFNWDGVSAKSREIFCHWLVEEDLEIFFNIIKQTALDRMWRYREKFWRAYLPHISNTWIFLGNDAKRIARQLGDKIMKHGNLENASDDQSVLVLRIGRYVFSEWSHNGKLRAHDAETANIFFGLPAVSRTKLIKNFVAERIHSSPKTYYWQKIVSEWLKANCGVNKTQRDWGL